MRRTPGLSINYLILINLTRAGEDKTMSMLKKATNKMAYAKVGLYGDAGSGKTFTAAQIAIGLHQFADLKKPVAMFDTEPAASFIVPHFEKAGIEFFLFDESRAQSRYPL